MTATGGLKYEKEKISADARHSGSCDRVLLYPDYVIAGTVTLVTDTAAYTVHKGETFYLDGKRGHYLRNDRKTTAQVLWVSTPPLF